jgi:hypothetical protein
MIDMASVYADRYRETPDVLSSAVMGQSPDPKLDPYTALNALKLVNEAERMAMAGQAQQPTSSPSILAENIAPPATSQGLAGMVPMGAPAGQMPQGMPPQGMPPQGMPPQGMPQQTMQAASGGLANMYTPEEDFAEGGIVAFQSRGYVDPAYTANSAGSVAYAGTPAVNANPFADNTEGEDGDLSEREKLLALIDEIESGGGDPNAFAAANKLGLGVARRIAGRNLRDLDPDEAKKLYATKYKDITDAAGPSPYTAMRADIAEQGKERAGNLEFAKGEALLQAASDVLEGNNAMRGLAKGGAKFAKVYGEAQRADKAVKRSMSQMEFHINDAERKERAGNSRAATAAVESARKDRRDMNKAELDSDIALGRLVTEMGKLSKPRAAGAGAGPKPPKLNERLYDDNLDNLKLTEQPKEGETPKQFDARMRAEAGKLTARQVKDFGPEKAGAEEAKLTSKADTDLDARVAKDKIFDPAWQNAATPEAKDAAETALRNRIIARRSTAPGKPSGGGVNKNSTTAPDISTIEGAPAGSTIGKQTAKGWEVLDPLGKVIGHAKK